MPAIKTARTVWLVRAGRCNEEENQEQFALDYGLTVIYYPNEGDLRAYHCDEQKIMNAMRGKWEGKVNWRHPRQCHQFACQIESGDLVMLPLRFTNPGKIAIGKVLDDYDYRIKHPEGARHCRPVKWLSTTFPRSLLRDGAKNSVVKSLLNLANLQGTVAEVNCENPREAAEKLLSLLAAR